MTEMYLFILLQLLRGTSIPSALMASHISPISSTLTFFSSNRNSLRGHNHTGHWSTQTERQTQQPWLNPCPFALLFLWLFHYGNGIFVHKTWTAVDTGGQHPTKSYLVQICFGPVTFTPIVQIAQMLTCWFRMCARLCARLCFVHFPSISTDRFGTVNGNKMQSSSFGFCNTSWRHHNHRK